MTRTLVGVLVLLALSVAGGASQSFDHDYRDYAALLGRHVKSGAVDYTALKAGRGALDAAVSALDATGARELATWTRGQQMAFWINAYNLLTLRAIVDHYPIRAGWLTRQPRNSIRQIDGVWTTLRWQAAGRSVSLDDIEHRTLRPDFKDARIHFAVNCASVSCPPLAAEPYRAATLDAQLDASARRYLTSSEGVRIEGGALRVSSLFDWYGDDFIAEYSSLAPAAAASSNAKERAILGTLIKYASPDTATRIRAGGLRIAFLDYDWSLNDTRR